MQLFARSLVAAIMAAALTTTPVFSAVHLENNTQHWALFSLLYPTKQRQEGVTHCIAPGGHVATPPLQHADLILFNGPCNQSARVFDGRESPNFRTGAIVVSGTTSYSASFVPGQTNAVANKTDKFLYMFGVEAPPPPPPSKTTYCVPPKSALTSEPSQAIAAKVYVILLANAHCAAPREFENGADFGHASGRVTISNGGSGGYTINVNP